MNILHVGDIVGSPGRMAFARVSARLRNDKKVDFVIANGENSAAGKGITAAIADELFSAGANVITLGDHTWDQKEIVTAIDMIPNLIRPANLAPGCPGRGIVTVETPLGKVTVISLMGRVFMQPVDCPFRAIDSILQKQPSMGSIIMVEIHAEATSEKIMMGRYLEGRVTSVVGTHTHVQTSDETILPKGTAYITDLGMTGPKDSIIGRDIVSVRQKFLTGMPAKFDVAKDDVALEGVIISIEESTGRARKITRVRERLV